MPPKKSKEKKVKSTGSVLCDNGKKPSVVATSGRRYCVDAKGSRKYIDPVSASKKNRPGTPTAVEKKEKKKPAKPVRRGSVTTQEPKKVVMTGAAFCVARDKFVDERKHEYCFDDNGDPVFTGRRNVSGLPVNALNPVEKKEKRQKPVVVHVHVPKAPTPAPAPVQQKIVRVRAPSPAPAPAPAPAQIREKIVHVPEIQIVHVPVPVRTARERAPSPAPAPAAPVGANFVPRQPTMPSWPRTVYTAPAPAPAPAPVQAARPGVRFDSKPQVQTYSVERNTSDFVSSSDHDQEEDENQDYDEEEEEYEEGTQFPLEMLSDDDEIVFPEIKADVPPPKPPTLPGQLPQKHFLAPKVDDRNIWQRNAPALLGGRYAPPPKDDAAEVIRKTKEEEEKKKKAQ